MTRELTSNKRTSDVRVPVSGDSVVDEVPKSPVPSETATFETKQMTKPFARGRLPEPLRQQLALTARK